jgi:hypothetical protein
MTLNPLPLAERLANWAANGNWFNRFVAAITFILFALAVITIGLFLSIVSVMFIIKLFHWWSLLVIPVLIGAAAVAFNSEAFGKSEEQKKLDAEQRARRGY